MRYKRPGPLRRAPARWLPSHDLGRLRPLPSRSVCRETRCGAGGACGSERARAGVRCTATCHLPCRTDSGLPEQKRCVFGNADNIGAMLGGTRTRTTSPVRPRSQEHGDRGIPALYSSCRSYGEDTLSKSDAEIKACEDFNAAAEAEIYELHKQGTTVVIVSTMWNSVFRDSSDPKAAFANTSREYYAAAAASIDQVVSRLEAAGLRVLIVGPFQLMPHDVPQCPRAQRARMLGTPGRHGAAAQRVDGRPSRCRRATVTRSPLGPDRFAVRRAVVPGAARRRPVHRRPASHGPGGATLLDGARDSLAWSRA